VHRARAAPRCAARPLDAGRDRHGDLLSGALPPPALLRRPRLQGGRVPSQRARRGRRARAADLPRADRRAAGVRRRQDRRVLRGAASTTMTTAAHRVAVLGCGYWGKNLVRNFHALGALAAVADTSPQGRATAAQVAPGVAVHDRLDAALEDRSISGIVIG